jgi:hypothetical protein
MSAGDLRCVEFRIYTRKQAGRHVYRKTSMNRQVGMQIRRVACRKTSLQAGKQAGRQARWQTNRYVGRKAGKKGVLQAFMQSGN